MAEWVPTTDSRLGNRFSLDFRAGVEEVTTTSGVWWGVAGVWSGEARSAEALGVAALALGVLALVMVMVSGEAACPVEETEVVFAFLGVLAALATLPRFFLTTSDQRVAFAFLGVLAALATLPLATV